MDPCLVPLTSFLPRTTSPTSTSERRTSPGAKTITKTIRLVAMSTSNLLPMGTLLVSPAPATLSLARAGELEQPGNIAMFCCYSFCGTTPRTCSSSDLILVLPCTEILASLAPPLLVPAQFSCLSMVGLETLW